MIFSFLLLKIEGSRCLLAPLNDTDICTESMDREWMDRSRHPTSPRIILVSAPSLRFLPDHCYKNVATGIF